MRKILLASIVAIASASIPVLAQQGQEEGRHKVPKDSVEVTVTGCLKGRVLQVSEVRPTDVQSGPPVNQRSLRLAGKKDIMKTIKEADGHYVELLGLIKKSSLIQPGVRFKGGRVVVGGGTSMGGSRIPDPVENVVVLDVSAVQSRGSDCR